MDKLRIMLADDHETVRAGIKMIVNAQPDMEIVGEAGDGFSAIARARELNPEIIVMDVSMPEMSGLQATLRIKKLLPEVKILTLTRHTDEGYLQELLRAGASGYVLKQSAPTELIHAIRAVASGGKYLDPTITEKVIGGFANKQVNSGTASVESLSTREGEILRQIAWGYSNKEIAHKLNISVKTVEAHKANAMRKLDMRSRIDIVRFAILQGWLQEN